jgi:hypothetical protein
MRGIGQPICILLCSLFAALAPRPGFAETPPASSRQSLDDAWWTGPMLANTAASAPRGHGLIEPYFYDVTAAHSNSMGTFGYLLYGVTDKLSIGLNPQAGFNSGSQAPNSAGAGVADTILLAQYGLTAFDPAGWLPTTALSLQETLPTGRYDRLGTRSGNGFGNGAYTTTLGLYSQSYLWLPNGRLLRARLNVQRPVFSSRTQVHDVSVYGTGAGFRGNAQLGSGVYVDTSFEYSLTRSWVLAFDLTFRHGDATRLRGHYIQSPSEFAANLGSNDAFAFAPAIEYSWAANIGVLLGMRIIPASHNTGRSLTPVVAINYVY